MAVALWVVRYCKRILQQEDLENVLKEVRDKLGIIV